MPDYIDGEPKYYQYSSGLMGYAVFGSTSATFRLYGTDGTMYVTVTDSATLTGSKMSLQLKEPMKVVYGGAGLIKVKTISGTPPGPYAISQTNDYTLTEAFATWDDKYTFYIIIAENPTVGKLNKMNYGYMTGANGYSGPALSNYGKVYNIHSFPNWDDYIVLSGLFTNIKVVHKITMAEVYAMTTSFQTMSTQFSNTDSTNYYIADVAANSLRQFKLTATSGSGSYTQPFPNIAFLTASNTPGLMNTGIYQYLAFTDGNAFQIVDKTTFTKVKTIIFPDGIATRFRNMMPGNQENEKFYFGRQETTNKNFQSYYLLFDNCTYRPANKICNQCPTGYYFSSLLPNNDCLKKIDFPPANGVNTGNNVMTPCQTGCAKCLDDYTVCTECIYTGGYFLNVATHTCSLKAGFLTNQGADTTDYTIKSCSLLNCDKCVDKYTVCTLCNAGYYLHQSTSCIQTTSFPPSYGIDTVNKYTHTCSADRCTDCINDYTNCLMCDYANGYYLDVATKLCIHTTLMPRGKGANLSTKKVDVCVDVHCKDCSDDVAICQECEWPNGYYKHPTLGCINSPFPSGFGPDTTLRTVVACKDPNCSACPIDSRYCTGCNNAGGWYVLGIGCVLNSAIPAGYGFDTISNKYIKCSEPACSDCAADYSTCVACDTEAGFYLTPSQTCSAYTTMPTGYGADPISGLIKTCSVPQCTDCSSNYQGCIICSGGLMGYSPLSGIGGCVLPENLPSGFGAEGTTGMSKPCASAGCLNCKADYQICTECDTANGYILEGNACKLPSKRTSRIYLESSLMDKTKNYIEVKFDSVIKQITNINEFRIEVLDNYSNEKLLCTSETCLIDSFPTGFNVRFNFPRIIFDSTISIYSAREDPLAFKSSIPPTVSSPDGFSRYYGYPIVLEHRAILSGTTGVEIFAKILFYAVVVMVGLQTLGGYRQVSLIHTLSTFMYLHLLAAKNTLVYPFVAFLYLGSNRSLLNLWGNNPWDKPIVEIYRSDLFAVCVPDQSAQKLGLTCSLLQNFGHNILSLLVLFAITFMICITMYLSIKKIREKLCSSTKANSALSSPDNEVREDDMKLPIAKSTKEKKLKMWYYILSLVHRYYGIRLFLQTMRKIGVMLMCLALINMSTVPTLSQEYVALWIGFIFIIFHYILVALSLYFVNVKVMASIQSKESGGSLFEGEQDQQKIKNNKILPTSGQEQRKSSQAEEVGTESMSPKSAQVNISKFEAFINKIDNFDKPSTKSLTKEINFESFGGFMKYLDIYYEDMVYTEVRWKLYAPICECCRDILICSVVVLSAAIPILQNVLVLLLEIAYIVFELKSNVKTSRFNKIRIRMLRGGCCLYIFFNLISMAEMDKASRQSSLGILCFIVLIFILLVDLLLSILILVIAGYKALKHFINVWTNQTTYGSIGSPTVTPAANHSSPESNQNAPLVKTSVPILPIEENEAL